MDRQVCHKAKPLEGSKASLHNEDLMQNDHEAVPPPHFLSDPSTAIIKVPRHLLRYGLNYTLHR